jgi:hypothetical protein
MVNVLSTPANPVLDGISPNVCGGAVGISGSPGSGYPSVVSDLRQLLTDWEKSNKL